MTNLEYRKSRGTHKPFRTTPAQAQAEYARLYPEHIERVRQRRAKPKSRTPWGFSFQDED